MSKHCKRCNRIRNVKFFYRAAYGAPGYRRYCKDCHNYSDSNTVQDSRAAWAREWRKNNLELARQIGRQYATQERIRNKDHYDARKAVSKAIEAGTLLRMPCRDCEDTLVQVHHHNGYSKEHQLDVVWLCKKHHRDAHRQAKIVRTTKRLDRCENLKMDGAK